MRTDNNTLDRIQEHLSCITQMIGSSDFQNENKEQTINKLMNLSNSCTFKSKTDRLQFESKFSGFVWDYDKMRIYFLNQREQLTDFHESYIALIDLRNELFSAA